MEFQVAREPFLRALQLLQNIVEPRQTLPILANVLIEARSDALRLSATDLEVGARVAVPATVRSPGAVTLAARKLVELVRELPSQPVAVSLLSGGGVDMSCGSARFKLVGLPAEEYPPLDLDAVDAMLAVDGGLLRTMVARTSYAMSLDESRPFLNGLYLVVRKGELRLVATDGHRLALARTSVDADLEMAGIVPRKAVQELTRVLGGAQRAEIAIGESKFFARTEGFDLMSKVAEGQFPNYEQVIPKSSPLRAVIEREPLLAAIRRVAVVADDRTRPVKLTLAEGQARLSAESQELGRAEEEIPADYEGVELTIGFNARYLLDALGPMDGAWTVVGLKDALSPGVWLGAADKGSAPDDTYRCVIMPMRM
jgi:DNA polymerase III subunit beta